MDAVALLSHAMRRFTAATTAVIRGVSGLVVDEDDGPRTTECVAVHVVPVVPGKARRGGDAARRTASIARDSTSAADLRGSESGDR